MNNLFVIIMTLVISMLTACGDTVAVDEDSSVMVATGDTSGEGDGASVDNDVSDSGTPDPVNDSTSSLDDAIGFEDIGGGEVSDPNEEPEAGSGDPTEMPEGASFYEFSAWEIPPHDQNDKEDDR